MLLPAASNIETSSCPLCDSPNAREYSRDRRRQYLRCTDCGLVFVPSSQFLSAETEKKRYDLHRNSPDDTGYRSFLDRLFIPLRERLAPGNSGLDFGSGPVPLLSRLFEEAGHRMAIFDRFYEPVPVVLEQKYDFITASEVMEHLREPRKELDRLWECLRPGGWLGIMTRPAVAQDVFPHWHYKNDPTHVCFYSPATFTWLAGHWNADLDVAAAEVILYRKRADPRRAGGNSEARRS